MLTAALLHDDSVEDDGQRLQLDRLGQKVLGTEYMAAGLPVVASRIGQIEELIADGETGLLCEPDDPRSLAEGLRRLRTNPALRRQLGTAARAAVVKDHTWQQVTRRIFLLAGFTLPVPVAERRSGEVRC